MVLVKPLTVHWHQDSAPIYSACFQPREQSIPINRSPRLVTAGGDNNLRVWRLKHGADPSEPPSIEYYSTLDKHERAVNAVAFDPLGQVLASAGDDGVVCLWALTDSQTGPEQPFGTDYEDLETWRLIRKCRTASFGEIYDLSWSPSGRYLAATSMDKVVSILDTTDGSCVSALRDHKHYVQGVSWDPLNEYLATQSSDQRVLIYSIKKDAKNFTIGNSPSIRLDRFEIDEERVSSFHSESFSSFFRRLSFSPDGSLLIVPAGQIDKQSDKQSKDKQQNSSQSSNLQPNNSETNNSQANISQVNNSQADPVDISRTNTPSSEPPTQANHSDIEMSDANDNLQKHNELLNPQESTEVVEQTMATPTSSSTNDDENKKLVGRAERSTVLSGPSTQNCALVYNRNDLRKPAAILPLPKSSLAVKFCPVLFKLRHPGPSSSPEGKIVDLPYRMVFAIATLNGVFIYDTEQLQPLGTASNLHYSTITDLAWSPNGRYLLLTSIDGFCSLFRFDKGELGEIYEPENAKPNPSLITEEKPLEETISPALSQSQPQRPPVINTLAVRKKVARNPEPMQPETTGS